MSKQQIDNIIFVVDTNILIDLELYLPIEMNQNFWALLGRSLEEGKWILLDVVADEIKYNQPLIDWVKKQKKNDRITYITDDNKVRGVEINIAYPMINEATQKSEVDTYLIAFAEQNKKVILSREGFKDKTNPKALNKIPDTCKELGVQWQRKPKTFFKVIGYTEGCIH